MISNVGDHGKQHQIYHFYLDYSFHKITSTHHKDLTSSSKDFAMTTCITKYKAITYNTNSRRASSDRARRWNTTATTEIQLSKLLIHIAIQCRYKKHELLAGLIDLI